MAAAPSRFCSPSSIPVAPFSLVRRTRVWRVAFCAATSPGTPARPRCIGMSPRIPTPPDPARVHTPCHRLQPPGRDGQFEPGRKWQDRDPGHRKPARRQERSPRRLGLRVLSRRHHRSPRHHGAQSRADHPQVGPCARLPQAGKGYRFPLPQARRRLGAPRTHPVRAPDRHPHSLQRALHCRQHPVPACAGSS